MTKIRFTSLSTLTLLGSGDAFVLVYSVDNEASYDTVRTLRDDILQLRQGDKTPPPIVVVANKVSTDRTHRMERLHHCRQLRSPVTRALHQMAPRCTGPVAALNGDRHG